MRFKKPKSIPWVDSCLNYRKSIVCVQTDSSFGTGWIAASGNGGFIVATALHVVSDALSQGRPIRITTEDEATPEQSFVPGDKRVSVHEVYDLACLVFSGQPPGRPLKIIYNENTKPGSLFVPTPPLGTSVGWLGFPQPSAVAFGKPTPTFCQGHISAMGEIKDSLCYLVDGNVNPGMSGAPIWDQYENILGMVLEFHALPLDGAPIAFPGFGLVLPAVCLIEGLTRLGARFR